MERLDTVAQRVLADLRNRMERKTGEVISFPGKVARARGEEAPALASCESVPKRRNRRRRRKAG